MTELPFEQKSPIYLQVLIFIVVLTWGFMGFEVAQYRLVNLYASPEEWLSWASLLFVSMVPVLVAISWRMKTSISYAEPDWDLREREVTITEYKNMAKEYQRAYRHVLSRIDYPLILLILLLFIVALLFPFVTMQTTISIIAATPVLFGFLFVPFGILFANILFKFIPNEATLHLSYREPNQLQRYVELMSGSPGISWAGVRVTLGEAGGYYTIRSPTPIARVEDIEGVSWIECELDEVGGFVKVSAFLQLGDDEKTLLVEETPQQLTSYLTAQIVKRALLAYIQAKGEQELLEDVLEEVERYLKRFASSS
jgi:hypothetical protein